MNSLNTTSSPNASAAPPGRKKVLTKRGEKVALQVLISKGLYERLVAVAPRVYGATRGALSFVVEDALKHYLPLLEHTTQSTNPQNRVRRVYQEVKARVAEMEGVAPSELWQSTEDRLRAAIAAVRGSDPRTVAKWVQTFVQQGLLKRLGPRVYEFL